MPQPASPIPAAGPPRPRPSPLQGVGSQCLVGLALGAAAGLVLGPRAELFDVLGQIFLRLSQIAVMPYLICELVGALGGLSRQALLPVARVALLVWLLTLLLGAALVVWLPGQVLPVLHSRPFFSPDLLATPSPPDLVATYLPFNIFSALAEDNVPAVVLFSVAVGVLVQELPRPELLLAPIGQLRLLLRRLNILVARTAPLGVFGLMAVSMSRITPAQMLRCQGLVVLNLVAVLVAALLVWLLLVGLTPLQTRPLWRILRGPLAIAASSGNLLIALPLLVEGLEAVLPDLLAPAANGAENTAANTAANGAANTAAAPQTDLIRARIAALVPVGFALPGLGQVLSLSVLPFAAWFVDRPLAPPAIATTLLTAIPTVAGGLKLAVRLELERLHLPADLANLVEINAIWLYRQEKVLSLLGLVLLVVLVCTVLAGQLRGRSLRLLPLLALTVAVGGLAAVGGQRLLALTLQGSDHNRRILQTLPPLISAPQLREPVGAAATTQLRPQPVTLAAIRRRGVLRVGLRAHAVPWAYRQPSGRLVGYDADLARGLAAALGVRLEVVVRPLAELERLVGQQRLDLALGGILDLPSRTWELAVSDGYQPVHLALLVRAGRLPLLQALPAQPPPRPLVLAVTDPRLVSPDLRDRLSARLGLPGRPLPLLVRPVADTPSFLAAPAGRYDALLTTAEAGAAWSVLHPESTMMPLLGDGFPKQLVMLIGGRDEPLLDAIDQWLTRSQSQGLFRRLFDHWVRGQDGSTGNGPAGHRPTGNGPAGNGPGGDAGRRY